MGMPQTKTFRLGSALTLAVLIFLATPLWAQSQGSSQGQSDSGATPAVLAVYSGGALEGVRKVTQDASTTITTTAYVNLADAAASWFVPINDSDLLNVGFSAECRLINSANSAANQDWVQIRVMISAVPAVAGFPTFMEPYSDPTSPMAFCSANSYAMHQANWAMRVSGGSTGVTYTAQLQWKVTDNAPVTAGLQAWLDDWEFKLEAFN